MSNFYNDNLSKEFKELQNSTSRLAKDLKIFSKIPDYDFENVLEEYKNREKHIKNLEKKLKDAKSEMDTFLKSVDCDSENIEYKIKRFIDIKNSRKVLESQGETFEELDKKYKESVKLLRTMYKNEIGYTCRECGQKLQYFPIFFNENDIITHIRSNAYYDWFTCRKQDIKYVYE